MILRHRSLLHFIFSSALVCLSVTLMDCTGQPLTVDQLVERNVRAVGGREAIEAIKSIKFDLHIVDPDFEVDGVYYATRPGRMRIDIVANGQRVYTEAFNGSRGWQWKGKGEPVDQSETATGALRHGVELPGRLFGLHELRPRGHRLDLVGREKIEGVDYYVLRAILSDGYQTTLYIDPDSWLITRRRDVRSLHPDIDPTLRTIENRMSDFRTVNGLIFPFASTDTDLATGKVLEKTTVRSIEINPSVDPRTFDRL